MMFDSTYSFYRSKEWENLVHLLKLKRLTDDGFIICEHCGMPIVRQYDCIAHHKHQLTNENLNDLTISLNPDNIVLVHHRCHNEIHGRFLKTYDRKVYIVWGSPLSGKSSYVDSLKEPGDLIVDMDSIWQCFSGCARYEKPDRIKSNIFGVRDCVIEQVKYRRGKWNTAYIIGGYPFAAERERLADQLGAEEVFIDTSKEECIKRLEDNPDGRDIDEWKKYIDDWWRQYNQV